MDLKPNYSTFGIVLGFCAVGILPNFFFDSLIYAVLSYGFVGFLAFGYLVSTESVLSAKLSGEDLLLKTGPFGKKRSVKLKDIRRILLGKNDKDGTELIRLPETLFADKTAKEKYSHLLLEFEPGKFYDIARSSFSDEDFEAFSLLIRNDFSELRLLPSEKIGRLMNDIRKKTAADKKLRNQLEKNLFLAYDSVFNSRTAESLPQEPGILYHTYERNKSVRFFRENDTKPGVKAENVRLAENLAETARKNIRITESRLGFYDKTLEKLDESFRACQNREKLESVARNLADLQDSNFESVDLAEETGYQADVLVELQALTENIALAETEEKSILLRESLNVLSEFKLSGSETGQKLRDLNEKLQP